MLSYILNLIYPLRCIMCNQLLELHSKNEYICPGCIKNMSFIENPVCIKCGKPLLSDNINLLEKCKHCKTEHHYYEKGYSVFPYEDVRDSIHNFKFKGVKRYGIGFGKIMYDYMSENFYNAFMDYDLIIPVPIHKKRLAERGFNQAEILAEELCKHSSAKCRNDILIRVKNTSSQFELSPKEREENIENAFVVTSKESIYGKNILLIDDIYTTGSTIDECTKALLWSGANKVGFYSLSIAK